MIPLGRFAPKLSLGGLLAVCWKIEFRHGGCKARIPLKLPGPQKARSVTIMKLEVAETIGIIIAISNSGVTISRPPRRTGHSGQGLCRR